MELKNLNELKTETESKYQSSFSFGERRLPKSFKELITQFDNDRITYNEFSFIVQRTSEGKIVAPNQWLYIAAFYSSYCKELLEYKEELYNHLLPKYDNKKGALEEPIKACYDNYENAKTLLEHYPDGQNKEYLIRFLSDYKWWGGAKTIDRSDFCASAILSSAGLVNAAQGYVTDICKFLARNPEAESILLSESLSEEDNYTTPSKEELFRQLSAATFLRKALRIVIDEDPNLSKLEALGKYKETNKQLKINGFNLWRKKDELPLRLEDVHQDIEIVHEGQSYVMYLEWTPADMENLFFPVFNKAYANMFKMEREGNEYVLYKLSETRKTGKTSKVGPLQQIFCGAPGTGKSNTIKREVDEKGKTCFRTTFHPDSDYSTFVGTYKPSMKPTGVTLASGEREEVITYKFIPQAFTRAYVEAWRTTEEVYLVIEEINRGNCAQIFGDLFQLLDRKDGVSEYPVEADTDLATYLAEALAGSKRDDIPQEVLNGTKLILPSNLYIWATMNTSDQSLFPIDSAFKRRWEWKYIPIDTKKEQWSIAVDGENYSWTSFLEIVNERVLKATSSEDKQLGFYFCKAQNYVVSAETFVSKVLFYLWNDVFKDYDEGNSIFKDTEGKQLPFSKFYNTDGSVNSEMVKELLTALEIEKTANLVEPEKDNNNFDRYSLNGSEPKGKSDLGLSIMEKYLSEHSEANFNDIKQAFPDSMLGNVANRGLIVEESIPLDSYSRYYTPKLFTSADGIKYRIYKQWTVANVGNIIDFAREQGWNVEQAEQWDRKDNQA